MKIMIVDDEQGTRKLIKTVCLDAGFNNIFEASNGLEAKKLIINPPPARKGESVFTRKFNLIISDWMMPIMNGIELLQYVRKKSKIRNVPFILLTSQNDRSDFETAIKEGVTDYIVKPFTSEELQIKLSKIISMSD